MGKSAAADARESHSGDDVVSVMYHIAAKLAAQVANTDAACPHQITATVASQLRGSGVSRALVSTDSTAFSDPCVSAVSTAGSGLLFSVMGSSFPLVAVLKER